MRIEEKENGAFEKEVFPDSSVFILPK